MTNDTMTTMGKTYIRLDLRGDDIARFLRAWDDGDCETLDSFGVTDAFAGVQDFFNAESDEWNDRTTLDGYDGLALEIWGEEDGDTVDVATATICYDGDVLPLDEGGIDEMRRRMAEA